MKLRTAAPQSARLRKRDPTNVARCAGSHAASAAGHKCAADQRQRGEVELPETAELSREYTREPEDKRTPENDANETVRHAIREDAGPYGSRLRIPS
jgi:hypothetical protein